MGMNITEKLIKNHLVSGEMVAGKEIAIKRNLLLTSTTTPCRQALKTQMTINISRQ